MQMAPAMRMRLALFAVAMIVLSSGCRAQEAADDDIEKPAFIFTFYVRDDFVQPGATVVPSAFGDILVFDSPLRTGPAADAYQVGYASGQCISLGDPHIKVVSLVAELTVDGKYGTISATGRVNFAGSSWELGVTGGTGYFVGGFGVLTGSLVDANPENRVTKYDVNVQFDD